MTDFETQIEDYENTKDLKTSEWFPDFTYVQDLNDPVVQLENAKRFMKVHGHARGVFKNLSGEVCGWGAIICGNGFNFEPGSNPLPLKGEMEKLKAAGKFLNQALAPLGGTISTNDTHWANTDWMVAAIDEAIELAKSEAIVLDHTGGSIIPDENEPPW